MPSKSEKQHKLMEAAAHDSDFAKKAGIPQKVAKEFVKADKEYKMFQVGKSDDSKEKSKEEHGNSFSGG